MKLRKDDLLIVREKINEANDSVAICIFTNCIIRTFSLLLIQLIRKRQRICLGFVVNVKDCLITSIDVYFS